MGIGTSSRISKRVFEIVKAEYRLRRAVEAQVGHHLDSNPWGLGETATKKNRKRNWRGTSQRTPTLRSR